MTYDEACRFLTDDLAAAGPGLFKAGEGLQRAADFFEALGNPQESYKSIHLAGTSGKGTTAYMLEALLRAHGKSTGLYVSPHVYDIRERCMVDGNFITKQEFADTVSKLRMLMKSLPEQPTYFEATNALAFEVLKNHAVDYAIIETGLGGLYDSTNTIKRADKLALITTLGLDHTEVLGTTLPEIAAQKAGILPYGGQAIVLEPDDSQTLAVIKDIARERGTTLDLLDPRGVEPFELALPGAHQQLNAALAVRALESLARRDGFALDYEVIRATLAKVALPARFERREYFGNPVVIDGAHNPQKMAALIEALRATYSEPVDWLLALKKTKDAAAIMEIIAPFANRLTLTSFYANQEGQRAQLPADPNELAEFATRAGIKQVDVIPNSLEALKQACHYAKGRPVIVTGSFYMIGDLHDKLQSDQSS